MRNLSHVCVAVAVALLGTTRWTLAENTGEQPGTATVAAAHHGLALHVPSLMPQRLDVQEIPHDDLSPANKQPVQE